MPWRILAPSAKEEPDNLPVDQIPLSVSYFYVLFFVIARSICPPTITHFYIFNPRALLCTGITDVTHAVNSVQAALRHTRVPA